MAPKPAGMLLAATHHDRRGPAWGEEVRPELGALPQRWVLGKVDVLQRLSTRVHEEGALTLGG